MFHGRGLERRINSQEKEKSIENQSLDEHNLYFLNLHGLQLITLEASQIYSSLRICILCKNFISDISPLQKCTKLIKLDLHSNQIRMLPDKTFWSEMKELKLLFLHNNSFVKLKNVCSLSACPNLVALTLYDCPVTLKKGYRHVLVNSIWSLKILDHFVISDEEIIENWPLPERFSTFNKRLFCDITPQFFKETSYERELWQVNYIIAKINKIVAHNSPVVILQRWIRGHLTRGMWLKHYLNWLQTRRYQVPGKKINLEQKVKERKFPAFEDLSFFRETEEKQIPDERKFQRVKWLPVLRGISPSQHRAILSNALSELQKKESPLLPPMLKFRKVSKVPGEKKAVNQEIDLYSRRPGIKIHSLPYILKYPSKPKGIKQEIHHRPIYRLCHFISDQPKFKIIHRLERFKKKATARPSCIVDFTPLNSIDRQYRNQKKMENFQNKIESVGMLQIATEDANENLQAHIQQKNHFIKKRAKEDKKKIEESLQKLQETRAKLMKKFQERRNFFKEEARTKAQERQIVIDKLSLHCSLAKEYFQYDRLKNRQDILKMKKSHVKEMREINLYHKELLEKMKNGRIKAINKRHLEEKLIIQTITAKKASDRLQEARDKVAAMKSLRVHVNVPLGQKKESFPF